jgi:hypothetical protein
MPPKIQFSEKDKLQIIKIFHDFNNKIDPNLNPKTMSQYYKDLTGKHCSYTVLFNQYVNIPLIEKENYERKTKCQKLNDISSTLSSNSALASVLKIYDESFIQFIKKNFENTNTNYIKFQLDISLNTFLRKFDLKSIEMPSNGLSGVYAIQIFLKQFQNINYNHKSLSSLFINYFSSENFKIKDLRCNVKEYFSSKMYDHLICNYVDLNLSKLFNIPIFTIILDGNDYIDSIQYNISNTKHFSDLFVLLTCTPFKYKQKDCFMFNLIIDNDIIINYNIDLVGNVNILPDKNLLLHNFNSNLINQNYEDEYEYSDDDDENFNVYSYINENNNVNDKNKENNANFLQLSIKPCKCGSYDHKRISHNNCILNKKLQDSYNQDLPINHNEKNDSYLIAVNNKPFDETKIKGNDVINGRHFLGQFEIVCNFCKALLLKSEATKISKSKAMSSGFCCSRGRIKLPEKKEPPNYICELIRNHDKDFIENIRAYNSAMAFTSFGASLDLIKKGVPIIKIHGITYHNIGSLYPSNNNMKPMFAQLYLYDAQYEHSHRIKNFSNLNEEILKNLRGLMHNFNPYVSRFKQFGQIIEKEKKMIECKLVIKDDQENVDKRIHNKPVDSDFAVILPG